MATGAILDRVHPVHRLTLLPSNCRFHRPSLACCPFFASSGTQLNRAVNAAGGNQAEAIGSGASYPKASMSMAHNESQMAGSDRETVAYVATRQFGLYRSEDFTYGDGDPTWIRVGREISITVFALDLSDPDGFQACRVTDTIYVRTPAVTGPDWRLVLQKQDVASLIGVDISHVLGISWVEINSQKPGHMYTMAGVCSMAPLPNRSFYLLKSDRYGDHGSWSAHLIPAGGTTGEPGAVWRDGLDRSIRNQHCWRASLLQYGRRRFWSLKQWLGASDWQPRVLVDPTDQTVSYAGIDTNGPDLAKATTIDGVYSQIDGGYAAGIAIWGAGHRLDFGTQWRICENLERGLPILLGRCRIGVAQKWRSF